MLLAVTVVIAVGVLALLGLLVAMRSKNAPGRAMLSADGYQEVCVTINGRYRPDTLEVEQGIPLRFRFLRREDNPCSERVVFSAFGVDRRLPAFQETVVEFVPKATGRYLFTCQWGMYRGRLVVTAPRNRSGGAPTNKSENKHV